MKKVTVYTTPTCRWCHRVKAYLTEKGVSFEEKDVSRDREAAMEMIKKTNQMGVPVLDIGGEMIVGFDKERINYFLGV
ncbi:glutaredoxin family protein [Proteiniclasticum ruminis]|uniref:Glutaredoxin-like protein, YruB-family n=1 Tax=Proteiniclasticum ruminis TaxID=398199 RepID=A0A1I4ZZM4_9CLOT|nr:glutaredoxin family protein [Proteiniclasticum ruminis]SFN55685.1 Glutaredoxin-like protein, YruB-family [Proteiniclasticum ruminis]